MIQLRTSDGSKWVLDEDEEGVVDTIIGAVHAGVSSTVRLKINDVTVHLATAHIVSVEVWS